MPEKGYKKNLILYLSLIGFFGIFTTTMAKNPVLPLFVKGMGGSPEVIGIISAISPLAGILFSFPVGMLSDRIGKRKILLISGGVFLTAPLLYLFVSDPWYLIPVRFFHGLATAILGPVASAAIAEAYDETKGEKLGIYSSATLIGRTLTPIAGGALISYFMHRGGLFPYKSVYVAAFLASVPAFLFCFAIKDTGGDYRGKKSTREEFRDSIRYFLGDGRLVSTALVDMATYFAFGVFETYLPVYLSDNGFGAGMIGFIFSLQILSVAITKPFFGRLADRIDKRIQIAVGLTVIGLSMLSLPFFTDEVPVVVVSLTFGLGMSLSTVATSAYTGDIADKTKLGASMGALSSVMDVGHSSGPLITGFVISGFSMRAGFAISFILCLVVALLFVVFTVLKKHRRLDENRLWHKIFGVHD
ncbi:MAG TPA: MFS transporter [Syntrophales bacterium]|nr:MFS transporter [Syntrophales bacterium]